MVLDTTEGLQDNEYCSRRVSGTVQGGLEPTDCSFQRCIDAITSTCLKHPVTWILFGVVVRVKQLRFDEGKFESMRML